MEEERLMASGEWWYDRYRYMGHCGSRTAGTNPVLRTVHIDFSTAVVCRQRMDEEKKTDKWGLDEELLWVSWLQLTDVGWVSPPRWTSASSTKPPPFIADGWQRVMMIWKVKMISFSSVQIPLMWIFTTAIDFTETPSYVMVWNQTILLVVPSNMK